MSEGRMSAEQRKAMTNAYRQTATRKGVYQIRNVRSGRVFVGASADLRVYMNRHLLQLRFGSHRSRDLQRDWNVQGEADFVFEVLEELKEPEGIQSDYRDDLRALEEKWLNAKRVEGPLYNLQ